MVCVRSPRYNTSWTWLNELLGSLDGAEKWVVEAEYEQPQPRYFSLEGLPNWIELGSHIPTSEFQFSKGMQPSSAFSLAAHAITIDKSFNHQSYNPSILNLVRRMVSQDSIIQLMCTEYSNREMQGWNAEPGNPWCVARPPLNFVSLSFSHDLSLYEKYKITTSVTDVARAMP